MREVLSIAESRMRQPVRQLDEDEFDSGYVQSVASDVLRTAVEGTPMRRSSVGLAAIQLGEPINLVAIDLSADRLRGGVQAQPNHILLANLAITILGEETALDVEGCHSLDELAAVVERPIRVRAQGIKLNGTVFDEEVQGHGGFLARVFQHEDDHNHGLTAVDRVPDSRLHSVPTKEMFRALLDDPLNYPAVDLATAQRYRSYNKPADT